MIWRKLLRRKPLNDWPYPNFSKEEMACKCGCGGLPEHSFMRRLQALRDTVGFPLPVTSGFRCPEYNNQVSSTGRHGPHTTGRAVDLGVSRRKAYEVVDECFGLGFTGIGVAQKGGGRFVHLDDLEIPAYPRPTIWSY